MPQGRIKKFEAFLESEQKAGYVKVNLSIPGWEKVLDMVDPLDLAPNTDGYSKDPHITVLYGFSALDENEMKSFLENIDMPKISIGKVSIFENPEFDVVKMEADGDVRQMHENLKRFPHNLTHADYSPHITIAYVKKGTGSKYSGMNVGNLTVKPTSVVYTGGNRNTKIAKHFDGRQ